VFTVTLVPDPPICITLLSAPTWNCLSSGNPLDCFSASVNCLKPSLGANNFCNCAVWVTAGSNAEKGSLPCIPWPNIAEPNKADWGMLFKSPPSWLFIFWKSINPPAPDWPPTPNKPWVPWPPSTPAVPVIYFLYKSINAIILILLLLNNLYKGCLPYLYYCMSHRVLVSTHTVDLVYLYPICYLCYF